MKISNLIYLVFILSAICFPNKGITQQDFVPPSPEVAAINKFIDIPVDGYTGIPNINIPLTSLESKSLNIPVSISYHAGGIKVAEEASEIGLGWSLNAGGVISREIRGEDDFGNFKYSTICWDSNHGFGHDKHPADPDQQGSNALYFGPENNFALYFPAPENCPQTYWPSCSYNTQNGNSVLFSDICLYDQYDYESDIYSFNFLGESGKFIFKHNGDIMVLNNPGIIIDTTFIGPHSEDFYWTITLDNGYQGKFGNDSNSKQKTTSKSHSVYFQNNVESCISCSNGVCEEDYISAWKIDEITTPDGDNISFTYNKTIDIVKPIPSYSEDKKEPLGSCSYLSSDTIFAIFYPSCAPQIPPTSLTKSFTELSYDRLELQSIKSNIINTEIIFNYDSRLDLSGGTRLSSIEKKINGSVYQTINLHNDSYFESPDTALNWITEFSAVNNFLLTELYTYETLTKRLKLDSLEIIGHDGTQNPATLFKYNEQFPIPDKASFEVDLWGYYNGANGNTSMIPEVISTSPSISNYALTTGLIESDDYQNCANFLSCYSINEPGADRSPNDYFSSSWSIESITQPTGVQNEFEFESNSYKPELDQESAVQKMASVARSIWSDGVTVNYTNDTINTFIINSCTSTTVELNANWKEYKPGQCPEDFCNCAPLGDCLCSTNASGSIFKIQLFRNDNGIETLIHEVAPSWILPTTSGSDLAGNFDSYVFSEDVFLENITGVDFFTLKIVNQWYPSACATEIPKNISVSAFAKWTDIASTNNSDILGGGLRVKSLTEIDLMTNKKIKKNYNYAGSTSQTSGRSLNHPLTHKVNTLLDVCDPGNQSTDLLVLYQVLNRFSSPYKGTSNRYAGSYVGYEDVKITTEVDYNYGVFSYIENQSFYIQNEDPDYQLSENYEGIFDFRNGKMLSNFIYDGDNKPLESNTYDYENITLEEDWSSKINFWTKINDGNNPCYNQIFYLNFNKIKSQWVRLNSKESIKYEKDGGSMTITEDYTYDENYFQRKSSTISNGTYNRHTTVKYPFDFPEYDFMVDQNMVSIPIETLVDGGSGGGTQINYNVYRDAVLLSKYYVYDSSEPTNWKEVQDIISYDEDLYPDVIKNHTDATTRHVYWGVGSEKGLVDYIEYSDRTYDFSYNNFRELTSSIDNNSIESTFLYDGLGRLVNQTANNGRVSNTYTYTVDLVNGGENKISNILAYGDGGGYTTISTLDGHGRSIHDRLVAFLDDGSNLDISTTYDALGRTETVDDPRSGGLSKFSPYKAPSSKVTSMTPAGSPASINMFYTTDGTDFIVETKDEDGISTMVYTDIFGNTRKTIDGMGEPTIYAYNNRDLVTSIDPPGSGTNYSYTYYGDGLLQSKTIPDKGTHTYTYDSYDQVATETLPNGKVIVNTYHGTYTDFLTSRSVDGTLIENYIPFDPSYVKDFIGEESYSIHTNFGVVGQRHEIQHLAIDQDFGRSLTQKVNTLDGEYLKEMSFDDTGNLTSNKITTTAHEQTVVCSESWTYPKGLRLKLYGFTAGELSAGSWMTYDGHDWLVEKKLADDLQIISYGYNPRGWLSKINGISEVSSLGASGCSEPEIPDPELDCQIILEVIQSFIIEYDCGKLNNGDPTVINIGVTSQSFDNGQRVGIDQQTITIPVNGATEDYEEVLSNSFSFDLPTAGSPTEIAGGIYQQLLDCLQANPALIPTLEALILQAIQDELDNGDGTTGGPVNTSGIVNTTKSMFGMDIHYFSGNQEIKADGRKNGNISWIEWQVFGEAPNAYGFDYDDNNRLLHAIHGEQKEPHGCAIKKVDKYSVKNISYDELGNIQSIVRRGLLNPDATGGYQYGAIDALEYKYAGSPNMVSSITDNGEADKGFVGGSGSYNYDGTGNIQYMSNKGLDIVYAFNDLPVKMANSNGKVINYYTSTGIKLKAVMEPNDDAPTGSSPIVTNYFEGQEFQNSKLNSIYFEEGRATYEEFPETQDDEEYIEYFLKDHLGNTRVRIADKNGDGKIKYDVNNPANDELMSKHHYYPYGMEWDVPNFDINGNSLSGYGDKTKYTYNGKEWLDELDIRLSDYGARYYDPAIGRFTSTDDFASIYHNFSSFNYAGNNPILNKDDGGNYIVVPNNSSASKTFNDLAKIYATPEGKKIIDALMKSDKSYTIDAIYWFNPFAPGLYNGFFREVNYQQSNTKRDDVTTPSFVILGHELKHAYDHEKAGNRGFRKRDNHIKERAAVRFGNYLRKIYGLGKLRRKYSGIAKDIVGDTPYTPSTNGLSLNPDIPSEYIVNSERSGYYDLRIISITKSESSGANSEESDERCVHCKPASERPYRPKAKKNKTP